MPPIDPTPTDHATQPPTGPVLDAAPVVGRRFGDYELLEEIARGGMGVVFRARQVSLNRVVALKMILAGQLAGDDDVRRFYQEAQTAANLRHPNIVAIHEVGQHDGQHFFSMDFIEGKSLSDLVRDNPLSPDRAAGYVETAARAVHFAHEHGVLHRDLKPSNVLIDRFDQPQVTDFGLAKKVEGDSKLTQTGAVVGTPSYMPPEQASGRRGDVGPASDVYALGAVLYELVTGRPPFRAATPLDTLLQVLDAEPASPRLLNPAISRDLETVILKCLAKEPARRYASAALLADDLTALRQGQPIRARRPGLGERAARWLRKEQRGVSLAARAILLAALVVGFVWLVWSFALTEGQGKLKLDTHGPPLRAEVLHADKDTVVARFRVPHEDPVPLPVGAYRVRLTAPGQLGQTYRLSLAGDQVASFDVHLDGRQAGPPLPLESGARPYFADLAGRTDLILAQSTRLRRLDGVSQKAIWDVQFTRKAAGRPLRVPLGEDGRGRTRLVRPAPDLDGDGIGDLVWVGQAGGVGEGLWALSGKDGSELWWSDAAARVFGTPLVADVDGAGPRDLIATLERRRGRARERWVEAYSGQSGRSRWRFPLDSTWHGGVSKGAQVWSAAAKAGAVVVALDGTRLVQIDPRSGKALKTHGLGFRPAQPPRFADFDGDGWSDALLVRVQADESVTLVAVSVVAGKTLWEYPLDWKQQTEPVLADLDGDGKAEVIVVNGETTYPTDRGGSVVSEEGIGHQPARPGGRPDPELPVGRWAARGVDVIDGGTGQRRWRYEGELAGAPLLLVGHGRAGSHQLQVGPESRAGGWRSVFVYLRRPRRGTWGGDSFLDDNHVVALSGHDGGLLWRTPLSSPAVDRYTIQHGDEPLEHGLCGWWPAGPLLIVRVADRSPQGRRIDSLYLLAAGTGRVEHGLVDVSRFDIADLDGDGLPELCYQHARNRHPLALDVLRGGPPVAWRRLGDALPVGDLDGDGVADLVEERGGQLTAVSGRDGRPLWLAQVPRANLREVGLLAADLNGDGHADVLWAAENERPALRALSGKDGRPLWSVDQLPGEGKARTAAGRRLDCRDLDGDGRPEVVFVYQSRDRSGSGGEEMWLAVLRGDSGRPLWEQPLSPRTQQQHWNLLVADVTGDGTADVVVLVEKVPHLLLLRAFDGRDGRPLWEHRLRSANPAQLRTDGVFLAAGDLDGSGRAAVVVALAPTGEVTLLGPDGQARATARDVPIGWLEYAWQRGFAAGQAAPLLLTAGKERLVCLAGWRQHRGQQNRTLVLTLLDGQLKRRRTVERTTARGRQHDPAASRILTADVDGDGREEVVFVGDGAVEAVRTDGQPVWRWQLPTGAPYHLVVVRPDRQGASANVVLTDGKRWYGLDVRTGRPAWRCDAAEAARLLDGDDPRGWPRLVGREPDSQSTVCQLPLPADPAGRYRLEGDAGAGGDPATEVAPRGRPLPWAEMPLTRREVLFVAPAVLILIFWLLRGDWFSAVRLILAAGLIAAVIGQVSLAVDRSNLAPTEAYDWAGWHKILFVGTAVIGVVLLPALLLMGLLRLAGWRGRWVLWLVPPLLGVLMCGGVGMVATPPGASRGPSVGWLVSSGVTALLGTLLLLGAGRWWRRRAAVEPLPDAKS